MAVFHNGAGPLWLSVLIAAAEWSIPPWEIAGGDKLTWWFRWVEYGNLRAEKMKKDYG